MSVTHGKRTHGEGAPCTICAESLWTAQERARDEMDTRHGIRRQEDGLTPRQLATRQVQKAARTVAALIEALEEQHKLARPGWDRDDICPDSCQVCSLLEKVK